MPPWFPWSIISYISRYVSSSTPGLASSSVVTIFPLTCFSSHSTTHSKIIPLLTRHLPHIFYCPSLLKQPSSNHLYTRCTWIWFSWINSNYQSLFPPSSAATHHHSPWYSHRLHCICRLNHIHTSSWAIIFQPYTHLLIPYTHYTQLAL